MELTIQLRSETNGISFVASLRDALIAAKKDASVWKISFNMENGERCRLVRRDSPAGPHWVLEPIFTDDARVRTHKLNNLDLDLDFSSGR